MKLNLTKMNKAVCLCALLWLFAGFIFRSWFHGFQENVEEEHNTGHFVQNLVQIQENVARRMQDGLITMVVKFLHFFISKCLQFRYSSPLGTPSFATSMLFWVALTRSVSSMADPSL